MTKRLAATVLFVLLTGCGLLERRERVVGEIGSFSEQDAVTVPTTVTQGEPFEITVTTLGGGCTEQGDTEVDVEGLRADVTPFDIQITPPPGTGCTLIGRSFPHTATLSFAEKGSATLVFHGRKVTGGGAVRTTETRTLSVR